VRWFRRLLWLALALVVATGAYLGWQAWHAKQDLQAAEQTADDILTRVRAGDTQIPQGDLDALRESAASAHDNTDGPLWAALTHLPALGDDVSGVRAVSASIDTLATDGIAPLADSVDGLDSVTDGGRIDLAKVRALQEPVDQASAAFAEAASDVSGLDSSGYVGSLRGPFEKYVDQVTSLSRSLSTADKTVSVLPDFLGGNGPRNYLLVFQNNAEIRATGGIPGSWALVHADSGRLVIQKQGASSDFGTPDQPVAPLSDAETAVYSDLLGRFWQDTTFTPDFPRAAELMAAHWKATFPQAALDGVVSVDPVALSYVLGATGPVQVGDISLSADNVVEELLNKPYLTLEPAAQDAFFGEAARDIFSVATTQLGAPSDFVRAVTRAAGERRLLVAPFRKDVQEALAGSQVQGDLPTDDDSPTVLVTLNDGTGSKMSYYLRYDAQLTATSCAGGRQTLGGTLNLTQTISADEAQQLPTSITGFGNVGIPLGDQLVVVRIFGPAGGEISDATVAGQPVDVTPDELDGRPVITLVALLDGSAPVPLTWTTTTAAKQTGPARLRLTPGLEPGDGDVSVASAC
jgi:Protein of unknown function (DUF4012)